MLKADVETSAEVLTDFFHSIWASETIPEDWARGLIVKLPKKGNLNTCDNWRGAANDSRLREEQAGFRKRRGCIDQIFALRNIIEQCLA